MKKYVEQFLTNRGWNHDQTEDVWTDPSRTIQGWIKVVVTAWYHLDANIQTEMKVLEHGHSVRDLDEYLRVLAAK